MTSRWLILYLVISGCGPEEPEWIRPALPSDALEIVTHADRLEVLALGEPPPEDGSFDGEVFDQRMVLGTVRVEPAERSRIANGLRRAVAASDGFLLCYSPHHGLRAQRGEHRIELSACFNCWQINVLTSDGPFIPIEEAPLRKALDPILERGLGLTFHYPETVQDEGGRWVSEDEEPEPDELLDRPP